jgi:hypothetical protein
MRLASRVSVSEKVIESVTVLVIERPLRSDSENVTLSVAVLGVRPSVRASDSLKVTLSVTREGARRCGSAAPRT